MEVATSHREPPSSCTVAPCRSAFARNSGCEPFRVSRGNLWMFSRLPRNSLPPVHHSALRRRVFSRGASHRKLCGNVYLIRPVRTGGRLITIRCRCGTCSPARSTSRTERLIFGTDSSFFPRGWHRAIYAEQARIVDALGVPDSAQQQILGEISTACSRLKVLRSVYLT